MKNLRVATLQSFIPSAMVLVLLLGTALVTRTVRTDKVMDPFKVAEKEESPITQALRVAELLDQERCAEAEFLMLAMPTTPIPMNEPPGTEAFQMQAQALTRLSKALIQSALKQGETGKTEEGLKRLRFCRALLQYRRTSPQAQKISQELKTLADSAEIRLKNPLI